MKFRNPFIQATLCEQPDDYFKVESKRGDADYVMSQSDLKLFAECPSRWVNGYRQERNEAMRWGSLVDALLMTPEKFSQRWAVKPQTYTDEKTGEEKKWNGNSKVCQRWMEQNEDKEQVGFDEYHDALQAVNVIKAHPDAGPYVDSCQNQVCVRALFSDSVTGIKIPVKGLIDMVASDSLGDFKTVASANDRAFARQVFNMGWHIQAAMYLDLYEAATGTTPVDFRHIVQESEKPFQTECRVLATEYVELGRMKYMEALRRYCDCLVSGHWPGYQCESTFKGWGITQPEAWMIA